MVLITELLAQNTAAVREAQQESALAETGAQARHNEMMALLARRVADEDDSSVDGSVRSHSSRRSRHSNRSNRTGNSRRNEGSLAPAQNGIPPELEPLAKIVRNVAEGLLNRQGVDADQFLAQRNSQVTFPPQVLPPTPTDSAGPSAASNHGYFPRSALVPTTRSATLTGSALIPAVSLAGATDGDSSSHISTIGGRRPDGARHVRTPYEELTRQIQQLRLQIEATAVIRKDEDTLVDDQDWPGRGGVYDRIRGP